MAPQKISLHEVGAKDELTHGFQWKSLISIGSHNKADIQRKTVVGYLEETTETKNDLGSRMFTKPLSAVGVKFSQKRNMYLFSSPFLEFYFTAEDMNSNL